MLQDRKGKKVLAKGRYSLAAGKKGTVSLRLTPRTRTLLRRPATVKALLQMTPRAGAVASNNTKGRITR